MALRVPLQLHPESVSAIRAIEVELVRPAPRRLELAFFVVGGVGHMRCNADLPRDRLWTSTCFEAFIRAAGDPAYYEVNIAPSGRWMAFHFDDYRAGGADADTIAEARGGFVGDEGRAEMAIDLERALDLPLDAPWQLGLSAVIEEKDGRKSYWALAHPSGAPDFHHGDAFALELPAAGAAGA
jgi:hypothetical protein